jgi:hypothetical protein
MLHGSPTPSLATALLALLLSETQAGTRTGPTSTGELLGCRHTQRAKQLENTLRSAVESIRHRQRCLRDTNAVMLAQQPWLEQLGDELEKGLAAADMHQVKTGPAREVNAGDDSLTDKHAAFAAAAGEAEPGTVHVQAGHPLDARPTAAQVRAATAVGMGLSEAAGELMRRFNDDLPPGFVAHITLASQEP